MDAFITMNGVTARVIADDAADHVVTLILGQEPDATDFLNAALVGGRDAVITRDGHEDLACTAVRIDEIEQTVTVIIGEPS